MYKNPYVVQNKTIPLIPLRGMSVFPHMVIHFDVGREKSVKALEKYHAKFHNSDENGHV